jgi:hypothetical protein
MATSTPWSRSLPTLALQGTDFRRARLACWSMETFGFSLFLKILLIILLCYYLARTFYGYFHHKSDN